MKRQFDSTEHTTNDTNEEAPAEQEPDTAIQQALQCLDTNVQAEAGKRLVRFPFGDYEICL